MLRSDAIPLARIAVVAAIGTEAGLRRELLRALRADVALRSVQEILLQTILFAGFPRAINALAVLESLVIRRVRPGLDRRRGSVTRGRALCRRVYGREYGPMMAKMRRLHPDLADWILRDGYGKVLQRPFMDLRTRELTVVAVLAATGQGLQLRSHLAGAQRVGASRSDIRRVLVGLKGCAPDTRLRKALAALAYAFRVDL